MRPHPGGAIAVRAADRHLAYRGGPQYGVEPPAAHQILSQLHAAFDRLHQRRPAGPHGAPRGAASDPEERDPREVRGVPQDGRRNRQEGDEE